MTRLEVLLARLGVPGVAAVGVLAACGALYFSALVPAQDEVAAQRLAAEQLRSRTTHLPAENRELRRFLDMFPPIDALNGEVERLHALARESGIEFSQADYRLERPAAGLWHYRVTLPARGTYAQVRGFTGALLQKMPGTALDTLRFERRRADDAMLDAQIRLTLFLRPAGDAL